MRLRLALLVGAVLAIAIALSPPVDDAAHAHLSAHMLQHLLLGMVAAPLLAAAGPIGLVLRRLDPGRARWVARGLRRPLVRRLAHPLTTAAIFAATLLVVHLPPVYGAALTHPGLHAVEHAALFWTAVLWWLPLVGRDPLPPAGAVSRLASGMVGMAVMVIVGGRLSSATSVAYPAYLHRGVDPAAALADQSTAGAIMSIGGMVVLLPLLLWSIWRALVAEEHRERVRETRQAATPGAQAVRRG